MKIKELLNAHPTILRKLKKPELESVFKNVNRALKRRYKTFEKHGAADAFREDLAGGLDQMPGTKNELVSEISEALAYMRKPEATYSGYMTKERSRMNAYNDTLEAEGGDTFGSLEEFRDYGRFMGDMQDRFGDIWKNNSDQVREMYEQGKRLGLDPRQLTRNYDYWSEHLDDLAEATPITWHREGRKVYASDYARKLGLPSIKSWRGKK